MPLFHFNHFSERRQPFMLKKRFDSHQMAEQHIKRGMQDNSGHDEEFREELVLPTTGRKRSDYADCGDEVTDDVDCFLNFSHIIHVLYQNAA